MAKIRILIADDHSIVRRGLRSLLESQPGWQVCGEAVNGRVAVERAKHLHPDIVILDISMPELNGLDACRQILSALPRTEILILTMHKSEEVARQVLRAGARGFLLKSDADENLVDAVTALAQHRPYLTPDVTEIVLQSYVEGQEPTLDEPSSGRPTLREREVIQLLAEGLSNKGVAARLGVSVKTIEAHRSNIMRKLNLHSVSELVRYAIRNQIVQP